MRDYSLMAVSKPVARAGGAAVSIQHAPSQAGGLFPSRHGSSVIPRRAALLVSAVEEDRQFLDDVFSQQGWVLHKTLTLGTALAFLRDNPVPVVITERDLPLGDWKNLLAAIQHLPRTPVLIVTDRLADERLWAEVLNLGGHDVLGKPFQERELLWVLGSAWRLAEDNGMHAPNATHKAQNAGFQ